MIPYSQDEIQEFLNSLQQQVYFPSTKRAYELTVNRQLRLVEKTDLDGIMTSGKRIHILGGLRYVFPGNWMPSCDIKDLYDVAFLLEIERVPTIVHDFPEIAKWRLRIGK